MHDDEDGSLKRRVLHMARWTLLGFGAAQVLRLVSNLLLARLLAPEAFGVMAIGYSVIGALAMLSDLGLEPALVQRRQALSATFVNTIWSLQIARGIGIGSLVLLSAVVIFAAQSWGWSSPTSAFSSPELPGVLGLLALAPMISGFDSTKVILASRNMQVAGVMKIQLVDALFASFVTIALALTFESIYAMPLGWIAGALMRSVLSHKALAGEPNTMCWDAAARAEIHGFGKWIFLSTAMTFVVTGGDRLLLGHFVSSRELGLYAIAFLLASTAQTLLHKFNSVGLPLFSEVARERPAELASTFHRMRRPIDWVALFCAGGLAGGAPFIIGLLYDARYQGAAPMLVALSLLVVATRYDLVSACWTAMGQTRWLTLLSFVRMVTLLVALPLGHHLGGAVGAAWGISAAAMVNHPVSWWLMHKTGLLNVRRELEPLVPGALGYGLGWAVSAWMAGDLWGGLSAISR